MILILTVFSARLDAEFVFLKDGAVIQGQILSDTKSSITIRNADKKKVKTIPRSEIMRILYTQLYMGKVYVQKTDGKSIICYMVDEDQKTCTFREDLYKPAEFKLKRDQVLFMTRGNPSGFQGVPETDRIDFKWFPPYNYIFNRYSVKKNSGFKSPVQIIYNYASGYELMKIFLPESKNFRKFRICTK